MFEIEKDVPVPVTAKRYPFADMETGDSFLISTQTEEETKKYAHNVRNAARSFTNNKGGKFVTRITEEGIRVWKAE